MRWRYGATGRHIGVSFSTPQEDNKPLLPMWWCRTQCHTYFSGWQNPGTNPALTKSQSTGAIGVVPAGDASTAASGFGVLNTATTMPMLLRH
jgi:hypothetical protein